MSIDVILTLCTHRASRQSKKRTKVFRGPMDNFEGRTTKIEGGGPLHVVGVFLILMRVIGPRIF